MKALVLAAGVGSRLGALTQRTPKCLLPIAERPLLDYWCAALASAGVREVYINTHHHAEQVRAYLNTHPYKLAFVEGHEEVLLGSAGTLNRARSFLEGEERFFIIYADNFAELDLERLLRFHESSGEPPLVVAAYHADEPRRCGIFELDARGRVIGFEEKPSDPKSNIANSGIHVATPAIFEEVPQSVPADIGFHVLPKLIGKMFAYVTDEFIQDVGTPAAYEFVCNRKKATS